MGLDITIGGDYSQILRDYGDSPRLVQKAYDGRVNAKLNIVRRRLSKEPAERPGQRYVRTHRLSGAWANAPVRRTGPMARSLENPMPYAGVVQGSPSKPKGQRQAAIHAGRWINEDEAMTEAEADELGEEMADDLAKMLTGRR